MDRRAVNFSNEEIGSLLSLVDEFKDVVECKKSDTVLWKDKEAAWHNISKKLEEIGFPPRTTKQLRDKWGNLKKETKKRYGDEKVESFKTGGGPKKIIRFTPIDDKIKSIVGVAITGDANFFDSDKSTRGCTDDQEVIANPEDCQQDKRSMAREEEVTEGSTNIFHDSNWSSWNPAALKTPKAFELSIKQEPKDKSDHLRLGPTWTPKRLLLENKIILNEHNQRNGKFIVLKNTALNPKLMSNLPGNKENNKPETVTKPETMTKPVIIINPETPTKRPLKEPASGANTLSVRTPISQESPSKSGMKKKTVLTTDCRIKINVLSEAKLELVNIQKESLKRERIIRDEEHALKMEQEKEAHKIIMRKHKIELKLLEMELKRKRDS